MPDETLVNVNKIFTTLRISYPAWYAKHYSNEKTEQLAKRIWLTGIKELSTAEVDRGLQRLVLSCEFPPSLFEFFKICKRVDGLPSLDRAFDQALSGNYKNNNDIHKVVKVAAKKTGLFDLQRGVPTDQDLKKRFAYNYQVVSERYAKGLPLDDPIPPALEHALNSSTKGVCDELIEQGIQAQKESGKNGYEAFKALKKEVR